MLGASGHKSLVVIIIVPPVIPKNVKKCVKENRHFLHFIRLKRHLGPIYEIDSL